MRAFADERGDQHRFATLFLCDAVAGDLASIDLRAKQTGVRRRFDRMGMRGYEIFGGTEVSWQGETRCWRLHMHLILIEVDDAQLRKLRCCWPRGGPRVPVKIVNCKVDDRLASYLQKFATYFRVGQRAVPLPDDRLGPVGIQDSHGLKFMIQAGDGQIRIDGRPVGEDGAALSGQARRSWSQRLQ